LFIDEILSMELAKNKGRQKEGRGGKTLKYSYAAQ
jgi:hypothetical protein